MNRYYSVRLIGSDNHFWQVSTPISATPSKEPNSLETNTHDRLHADNTIWYLKFAECNQPGVVGHHNCVNWSRTGTVAVTKALDCD